MSVPLFINWPDIYCTAFILCASFLSTQLLPFFYSSILEQPLLAHLWQINQKLLRNLGGGGAYILLSCRCGKMIWVPTHSIEVQPEHSYFCVPLRWRGNERALLHRWAHRYESIRAACVCGCTNQQSHLLILTWVSPLNLVTRIIVY